jgi:glycosyltransferase involved in cell wall biosynthesis
VPKPIKFNDYGWVSMRVLIPNHFPLEGSGSGIYTQNVARELTLKGHEVIVITPGHDEQVDFPFEVRTILFTPDGRDVSGDSRLSFNFPCFTTHPLSTTTFDDLDATQMQSYVDAFQAEIDEVFFEWQPEIIHAQHLWVTAFAAHQVGLPYVATAHGTDLMGFRKYSAWKPMALEGAENAYRIIAISHQVLDDTHELYQIPRERLKLVWNGFDEEVFHPQNLDREGVLADLGLPGDVEKVISFVGKLTSFKGVDVLLDAAASYEKQLEKVVTLIVGDGELRSQLEQQVEELELQGVLFLGHKPQDQVAEIYNLADVSVIPSRVEPFGLVAVEALACGTPVVATNEGGLPDFVNESVGTMVDVDDSAALSRAVISELSAASKVHKGTYAAEYALKNFSWSGQVDRMIEIYNETLGAITPGAS